MIKVPRVEYSKRHRFVGCHVKVAGHVKTDGSPQIVLSGGAIVTLEESLELVESILAARRTLKAVTSE